MELSAIICTFLFYIAASHDSYISYDPLVECQERYEPKNCGYPHITLAKITTVEDLDRCGPAVLPVGVRNYYWAAAGRRQTYQNNFEGFKKINIIPRILRDVSKSETVTTVLGKTINFPVGISPSAAQKLANVAGESGTAAAAASLGTVMILSMHSQTLLEDVAKAAFAVNPNAVLWQQLCILENRPEVTQLVHRAEKAGFSALVVSVDFPVDATISCDGRSILKTYKDVNFNADLPGGDCDPSVTFQDLYMIVKSTKLPVVAKGVMTAADAIKAAQAGAAAVFVSNHGGRQLDSERATIDALPEIAHALRTRYPKVEVYVDGGVRNGWDVFKALHKGAVAAFVGRPALWGLAVGGQRGVQKMLTILKSEFNESMQVAGYNNPRDIYQSQFIRNVPQRPRWSPMPPISAMDSESKEI